VWSDTDSMHSTHADHEAIRLLDGRVLVIDRGSAEIYDPDSGLWSVASSPLTPRTDFSATMLLDGKVLVAGGYDQHGLRTAEIYDPQSGGWSPTGSMLSPHSGQTATLLQDGNVLITNGLADGDEFDIEPRAEVFNPDDGTWARAGDPNYDRSGHTAILLNDGSVLVLGGYVCCTSWTRSTELYKPSDGPWYFTDAMESDRAGHTATLLDDGRVLVAGGFHRDDNQYSVLGSAELYDPLSGGWSSTGAMSDARVGHSATLLLSGKVLVAGGGRYSGSNWVTLDSAELYDPVNGNWSPTGSMTTPRSDHSATRLLDGRVLVVKGAEAEVYNPVTGNWSQAGTLVTPRSYHAAALLDDGRVLVIGGASQSGSCEIYDPSTNSWQETGSLSVARRLATASTLTNGQVLVAGGMGDDVDHLASVEVYNPLTGLWRPAESLPEGSLWHESTGLQSGAGLITGGTTTNQNGWDWIMFQSLAYNSETDSLYESGRLGISRKNHSATLLNDGRILVAGGDEGNKTLPYAEIYQPEPDLGVTPAGYSLRLSPDIMASQPLTLTNSGGSNLTWNMVENPPRTWLNAPATGSVGLGITDTLTISIDTHGLVSGETYTTTLHLTSNAANRPVVEIPVSLQVDSHIWLPLAQSSGYSRRFDFTGKCVTKYISEVAITWCVPRVDILQNHTMQVFTTWQVYYSNPNLYCVGKHSDAGNAGMYLTDNLGNWYDHYLTGEAAAKYTCIKNGETAQGWFLFPPAEAGAVTFAFHDEDQDYVIEDINLAP
jgi:N-acetylneuraminic acid mutarotase